MNVLVYSQHFWPETIRINEVAESLREAGCEVTVLTGQPNYPEGRIFDGYRASAIGAEDHPRGFTIHRVPLVPRGRGSAPRLVANYLSFILSAAIVGRHHFKGRRFDAILVFGSSPVLQALGALALRRATGAALVTWVQDLWPESLQATGFVRNRFALAIVAKLVAWLYRQHDLLLVQSPAFVAPVRALAGRTPVEVHLNPGERAFEQVGVEHPPSVELEPGFNVVFAGNLGMAQALDTVLDAAERLRAYEDVRLVIVGSGVRSAWMTAQIARRGLDNVRMLGRFPPEAMPGLLKQASGLLVSLARSPILEATVPSKVQAYLAAGVPIVASLDGEGARVVGEAGAGEVSPAEDADGLADAILRLRARTDDERRLMGEAGRRYYWQHFDSRMLARRLIEKLDDAVARRRQPTRMGTEPGVTH